MTSEQIKKALEHVGHPFHLEDATGRRRSLGRRFVDVDVTRRRLASDFIVKGPCFIWFTILHRHAPSCLPSGLSRSWKPFKVERSSRDRPRGSMYVSKYDLPIHENHQKQNLSIHTSLFFSDVRGDLFLALARHWYVPDCPFIHSYACQFEPSPP